jgi:Spy/CpxP family protein refolding chaperone
MTRRVYLYFALTFVLGVCLGSAATYMFAWYTGHWHHPYSRNAVLKDMQRQLQLSPPQVDKIGKILDDNFRKFQALQEQVHPQFVTLREQSQNEIRQVLNPAQLAKFNEIVREHEEHERRSHGH